MLGIFAVLLGASLATFFGRLLSVGADDLRGALGLSVDSSSWISTSYNMGMMFIGPFSVYVGGLLGPRRVLLWCASIFTAVSFFMPFAGHLSWLIAGLVIAGLTAGTFYPLTLSFILRNLPRSYVLYGIAAYAIDIVVTTHVADSYEAWVMRKLSWCWLFWTITVATPAMIVLVRRGIPAQPIPRPKPGQPSISWRGFFYASLGAALIYGALDQGQRLDWWRSGTFAAMVITGSFLVLASVVRHFSKPHPLVNYPFLRRRNAQLLGLTVMLFRFVLLASVVLVPSYLTTIQGYRPDQVGTVLLWLAIPQFFAGIFAVYLLGKVDTRLVLAAGFSMIALGCLMDSHITAAWSGNNFTLSQLVLALGEGLAFNSMVGAIILDILNSGSLEKPADVLTFAGFFQTIRLFGGEVGATFIRHFLQSRDVYHYNLLASGIQGGSASLLQRERTLFGAMHSHAATQNALIGRSAGLFAIGIRQQAFTLALADGFTLIAIVAAACLVVAAGLRALKVGYPQIIAAPVAGKTTS
ncbi:MAG TPA: MFS transporter [Acidobacteriaceae bacterium]|nr:MFS transporter [Acidobacteriaceae bacterium]